MAKNSEWGAAAYLSQSKYGKYGNSNYSDTEKEVMINNCSNYITGIGANSKNEEESIETCETNTYETLKGQAASTTGNITGIYDMSGGAWEYVMGYLSGVSETWGASSSSNHSGFESVPNSKYYETYISSDLTSSLGTLSEAACNGGVCYGQALSETNVWHEDFNYFVLSSSPWFERGGRFAYTSGAGVFCFSNGNGGADSNGSFRIAFVQSTN